MQEIIETFKSDPSSLTGEYSGAGQFSEVSLTPCETYAIKHGNHGFSDGWLLYAAKLLTMPADDRPHWSPVIHSLRIDLHNGTFVALLDAYEADDDGPYEGGEVLALRDMLDSDHDCEEECDCERCAFMWEAAEYQTDECVRFLAEIEDECGVPLYFDIGGNCMWDGNNVILNDPACVVGWQGAKKDQRYRDHIKAYVRKCAMNAPDLFIKGESECLS